VAALVIGVGFQDVILERLTTDDRGSADSRGWYNEMAFNIIKAQPFTGIGLNNLWLVQNDYLPIELMRIDIKYRYIVHNKYLLVWSETGLFGFMAFLLLLLAAAGRALRALVRAVDPYVSITMAGLLVALSVYLIHMMSDPFNARPRLQLLWLIIALIAAVSRIAREKKVFT
jgi:O-antigen ligase